MPELRFKLKYCLAVFFLFAHCVPQVTAANVDCQACNGATQHNLGLMYLDGIGGEKNEKKARELFEKASIKGDINSINGLGVMYRDGIGGEKNEKKARELFEKASTLSQ